MFKVLLIISLSFCFISCGNADKQKEKLSLHNGRIAVDKMRIIATQPTEDEFEHLDDYLGDVSYVKLAKNPLLASVKDVHISNGRIYIQDEMHRIVCYNMQGEVLFLIDSRGSGPHEYAGINAFAIDVNRKELVIYDNLKLSLMYYSSENGKYAKTVRLEKPNFTEMVFVDGVCFYNNRYHHNYPSDHSLHYSLLTSTDGVNMEQRYFPHTDAEEESIFSPSHQTFYDNDSECYYCRNFDNVIYRLSKDGLEARYKIELPNMLPQSEIERKTDVRALIKSNYSFGISNVYTCKHLLYYRFYKDGYIWAAFYDLKADKQICCAKSLRSKLFVRIPFFDVINGVYENRFWGLLTPEFISYVMSKNSDSYPNIFHEYDPQSDNPILAFYKVKL